MRRLWVVAAVVVMSACSDPPLKEYHQAQGAIDAARAADAERYAPADLQAAVEALKQYDAAVAQRDYRLALNHALDAYARAQAAAKTSANEKAAVRSRVEAAIAEAGRSVATGRQLLSRERQPAGRLSTYKRSLDHVDAVVQKARKALQAGDYLDADRILKGVDEEARRTVAQIRVTLQPPASKKRRN